MLSNFLYKKNMSLKHFLSEVYTFLVAQDHYLSYKAVVAVQ